MNRPGPQHAWMVRILVIACFLGWTAPPEAGKEDPAVPNSEIRGRVLGPDGRRASGVKVYVYHLATEELFSTTSNHKGEFAFVGLPYGYFDLAARSTNGLYVADQVANVGPGGKNVIQFRLQGFSGSTRAEQRAFPGLDEVPVGIARVLDQRMIGETFWRSAKGVSIIAGGSALVLLVIAGASEASASPFLP